MTLIIAEKQSVGKSIAAVIGADKKDQGFLSGNGFLVSWARGHLVQTASPKAYDEKYTRMELDDFPILPNPWAFEIVGSEDSKPQYYVLKKLMHRQDVKYIICATDAGREGELIFRLIYNHVDCKKPFKRLWISSLEPKAILDGMENLKPGANYDNLYAAASSRQKADWLYGINMTRLYSCTYGKADNGYVNIINVGRVQTPTINLIVERQQQIDNFIPQIYYSVAADCGDFTAYTKVTEKADADAVVERCNGKDAYVTKLEKADKKELPPALFDLTSLQREANRLYGYSAKETLDIAQKLYEAKLSTYPRTDSSYLTDDMEGSTKELIRKLLDADLPVIDKKLPDLFDIGKANIKAVINNKKVSDHHAILPTETILTADISALTEPQRNILQLLCYRLFCAVYTPRRYTATKIFLDIEGEAFTATGNQTQDEGFKAIQKLIIIEPEKKKPDDTENAVIPPSLDEGSTISRVNVIAKEKQTAPPKPYTEGTLLAALERAGTDITDEDLKDAIKGSGLGTPATRAGIIEGTIYNGYIVRKGDKKTKTLHPTDKAYALMEVIDDNLKSAVMTAEWEDKLSGIEAGKITEAEFLTELSEFLSKKIRTFQMISQADNPFESLFAAGKPQSRKTPIGACPRCGGNVYEGKKSFYCENVFEKESASAPCNFSMYIEDKFFISKGKTLTADMASKLLSSKKITVKGCKPKDEGKSPYDIAVSMELTDKYINYKMEFISDAQKRKGA